MSLFGDAKLNQCHRCGHPAPPDLGGLDGTKWNIQITNGRPMWVTCPACQTPEEDIEAADNWAAQQEMGAVPMAVAEARLATPAQFMELCADDGPTALGVGPTVKYLQDHPGIHMCVPVLLRERIICACFEYEGAAEDTVTTRSGPVPLHTVVNLTDHPVVCDFDPARFMELQQVYFQPIAIKQALDVTVVQYIRDVVRGE